MFLDDLEQEQAALEAAETTITDIRDWLRDQNERPMSAWSLTERYRLHATLCAHEAECNAVARAPRDDPDPPCGGGADASRCRRRESGVYRISLSVTAGDVPNTRGSCDARKASQRGSSATRTNARVDVTGSSTSRVSGLRACPVQD